MSETTSKGPLSPDLLAKMDAYWRAANYLSVGQIYLKDNPLLERPLTLDDVKPRLLGHWGTTPGLNFLYVHWNRVIRERNLDMIYIIGPGHGGPGLVANTYLEGSYTEIYPHIEQNRDGIKRLFRQFSWPYGIPSHVAPETPGSIHEGGELGYSLVHAFGAAFDNPNLIVACVVGDGEAETGALATSWHSNKFLDPRRDGAVLPILHLNGYKIAGPTVLARIPAEELDSLLRGYGYAPIVVEGDDPMPMHQRMAAALDRAIAEIAAIQRAARESGVTERPRWPMIVLRSPKGWTGPKVVDGKPVDLSKTLAYKGMMYSNVPNLASAFGYTNASWTLKCDLISGYVCRLLNYMDRNGYATCTPRMNERSVKTEPAMDFSSGYIQRALDTLPRQGSRFPWRLNQNYVRDLKLIRYGRLNDGAMEFRAAPSHRSHSMPG